MTRVTIDDRTFITAWQRSSSVSEVAEAVGASTVTASAKAAYLRKQGVVLKPMARKRSRDYSSLIEFANSLAADPGTSEEPAEAAPKKKGRKK